LKKQKRWPKNAPAVSGQLKRIAPNLRAKGVTVEWFREKGVRKIQIKEVKTDGEVCDFYVQPSDDEGESWTQNTDW
jgi:hypothetical protein